MAIQAQSYQRWPLAGARPTVRYQDLGGNFAATASARREPAAWPGVAFGHGQHIAQAAGLQPGA
jgi:hypothetical protein